MPLSCWKRMCMKFSGKALNGSSTEGLTTFPWGQRQQLVGTGRSLLRAPVPSEPSCNGCPWRTSIYAQPWCMYPGGPHCHFSVHRNMCVPGRQPSSPCASFPRASATFCPQCLCSSFSRKLKCQGSWQWQRELGRVCILRICFVQ